MSSSIVSHFASPNIQIQPRRSSGGRRNRTVSSCGFRRREVFIGLGGLLSFSTGIFSSSAADVKPPVQNDLAMDPGTPLVLESAVSTTLRRPRKSRTRQEKEDEEEVVVVEGIRFIGGSEFVKFDVYVNASGYEFLPSSSELAGSFVSVPHLSRQSGLKTSFTLGLTDLLTDIKADDDDEIVVTLVPRKGKVEIGGLSIRYLGDDYS